MSIIKNNRLELSKARLSAAFSNLELIIEEKMHLNKNQTLELAAIIEKVQMLTTENIDLSTQLANIGLDYNKIKNYSFEVMAEIDASIDAIEKILGQ